MRTRVLVCANVYPPNFIGGAELIAHEQVRCLQRYGCEMLVFAGEPSAAGQRYSMRDDSYQDIRVRRINLQPTDYSSDWVNFHHKQVDDLFDRVLDEFRPDVVHMHNIIGLSLGIIHRAKRKGIRTVLTVHDHWGFCYKNTLIKKEGEICSDYNRCIECMAHVHDGDDKLIPSDVRRSFMAWRLKDVDKVISPSLYLANTYVRAGLPLCKVRAIWYGIDVPRLAKVPKTPSAGKVRFTFIGYFGTHKGIWPLLEAAAKLGPRADYSLCMVGTGELLEPARTFVRDRNLDCSVTFLGKVDNRRIEEVLGNTDVLVLPSIWPENQPVTITEAMATHTAVIASDIGGIPEMVSHGVTGYLVPPRSVDDLVARMVDLIANPERARVFGMAGFDRIRDNSVEQQIEKILAVYDE